MAGNKKEAQTVPTQYANAIHDPSVEPVKLKNVPIVYADRPGRNKNVYPEEELIKAVEWWKRVIQIDPTHKYSLIKHPKDENEENFTLAAGIINDMRYDTKTKCLKADFDLLPTTWGLLISYLVKNNYPVAVSLRGNAQPKNTIMDVSGSSMEVVVRRDLKLEGIDFVMYPSFITTQITSDHVSESRIKSSVDRVLESFQKQYSEIVDKSEIQKMRNILTQPLERNEEFVEIDKRSEDKNYINENSDFGGGEMQTSTGDNMHQDEKLRIEAQKLEIGVERLKLDIGKLESEMSGLTSTRDGLQGEIDGLQKKIEDLNSQVSESSSEFGAVVRRKESITSELEAKTKELQELEASITEKKAECASVGELLNVGALFVQKNGAIFSDANRPRIRLVDFSDRVAKGGWSDVDVNELKKLVSLSGDRSLIDNIFAVTSSTTSEWTSLEYPVYQLFKSEDSSYDFDAVVNREALDSVVSFANSQKGLSLSFTEKRGILSFVASKYQVLENMGLCDMPEGVKRVVESRVTIDTPNPALNNLLTYLVESELVGIEQVADEDSENSDTPSDGMLKIELDSDVAKSLIESFAMSVASLFSDDSEEDTNEGSENVTESSDSNADTELVSSNSKQYVSKVTYKVFEQYAPSEADSGAEAEVKKFITMLLTKEDGSPTDFATSYQLTDGISLYSFFGVMKDAFAEGNFVTSLQMLKGVTGTAVVSHLVSSGCCGDDMKGMDMGDAGSTAPSAMEQSTENMDQPADGSMDGMTPDASTDEASDPSVVSVQGMNYAFNMTSIILSKYTEVGPIFGVSTDTQEQPAEAAPAADAGAPQEDPNKVQAQRESSEDETVVVRESSEDDTESNSSESTNVSESENVNDKTEEANKLEEIDMEKITQMVEAINDAFDSDTPVTEENVVEAFTSLLADFANISESLETVQNELNQLKANAAASAFSQLKDERSKALEQAGVDNEIIETAFADLDSSEALEKEYEKLLKLVNKVTESRNKAASTTSTSMNLTRKGTAATAVDGQNIAAENESEVDHNFARIFNGV